MELKPDGDDHEGIFIILLLFALLIAAYVLGI